MIEWIVDSKVITRNKTKPNTYHYFRVLFLFSNQPFIILYQINNSFFDGVKQLSRVDISFSTLETAMLLSPSVLILFTSTPSKLFFIWYNKLQLTSRSIQAGPLVSFNCLLWKIRPILAARTMIDWTKISDYPILFLRFVRLRWRCKRINSARFSHFP